MKQALDQRFKHGDVVVTNQNTSLWVKWLCLSDRTIYLDGYPSEIAADDKIVGLHETGMFLVNFLGNIFEDPSLICAQYYKYRNKQNFELYLDLIKEDESKEHRK